MVFDIRHYFYPKDVYCAEGNQLRDHNAWFKCDDDPARIEWEKELMFLLQNFGKGFHIAILPQKNHGKHLPEYFDNFPYNRKNIPLAARRNIEFCDPPPIVLHTCCIHLTEISKVMLPNKLLSSFLHCLVIRNFWLLAWDRPRKWGMWLTCSRH